MPFDFLHQIFCRLLVPHDVVACSEEMFKRQFMPPHAGANKISAIDGEHFQLVFFSVHIIDGKIHLATLELLGDPVFYLIIACAPGIDGFLVKLLRVLFVNLREERQPSHPNGKRVHVGRVVKLGKLLGSRGPLGVKRHIVVFPLTGMKVPQRSAVHQPRWPLPIKGTAEIDECGVQAGVLGADIMVEITAIDTVAAAQGKHHRLVAVIQGSTVIKMLDSRAGYEHRLAFGLLGIFGEFPSDLNGEVSADARLHFLPSRGIGFRIIVVHRIIAAQPSGYAGLRHQ